MKYKAPAFSYTEFEIKKEKSKKEFYVTESITGLKLPNNKNSKNLFNNQDQAIQWINNNFGLTDQQIEYNRTQGMLSLKSIILNYCKVYNIDVYELIPYKYNNIDGPETDYTNYFNRFGRFYGREYPLDKEIMILATEQGYFNYISDNGSLAQMIQNAYKSITA